MTLGKGERSKLQILEAAVDCLVNLGFHRTSLTRVAQAAEMTRSGLQYHFPTMEDLTLALCRHVLRREWLVYEDLTLRVPTDRQPLDYAIDFVASAAEERYLIARLELVTASRTTPALSTMLEAAAAEVDDMGQRFVDGILKRPGLSATERFTAARDLSSIVNDWLFAHAFPPGQREARTRAVLKALRISLHAIWGLPPPDYVDANFLDAGGWVPTNPPSTEQPGNKPRIRVAARRLGES